MTRIFIGLVVLVFVLYGLLVFIAPKTDETPGTATSTPQQIPAVEVIAENLEIPWDIAFLPDGTMLVTERTGDVLRIDPKAPAARKSVFTHSKQNGEGGLLGITLHPQFQQNKYVYLYMSAPGASGTTINRVVRYSYANETLTEDKVIISNIPGAAYHDGGRMEFGPDGKLYVTTGDAMQAKIAQDKNSLGGKILRLNDDGSIPSDNPFGTAVWSYGHRNPQGLAWDSAGNLWETEHGPTGEQGACCQDEINLIQKGGNYGWPTIMGDDISTNMMSPKWHSGDDTWAPASALYLNGSIFFGGLKGETLYEAVLSGTTVTELKKHFTGDYGRIRTIRKGPDGMIYMTTSNRDGRGSPASTDDRIIRINPSSLE